MDARKFPGRGKRWIEVDRNGKAVNRQCAYAAIQFLRTIKGLHQSLKLTEGKGEKGHRNVIR